MPTIIVGRWLRMRLICACVVAPFITAVCGIGLVAAQPPAPQEKPKVVRSIKYDNFRGIPIQEILRTFQEKDVKLKVESSYDQQEIDHAKAVLTEMLAGRGRTNSRVDVAVEPIPPRSVGVTFTAVNP
jgi:hypothetical protein